MLSKQGPYTFCCVILWDCSWFDATFGQLFTLQPPNFLFNSDSLCSQLVEKRVFFRMFMGNYFERTGERKKFRVNRFPNMEEKKLFLCTGWRSHPKIFLHFLPGIVDKQAMKKQFDHGFKKWGARRAKCEVLNCHSNFSFHEKCQSSRQVKMQNLPCNTPLFLVFWHYPEFY